LKHLERTTLLLHLVDVSETAGENPVHDFEVIRQELSSYHAGLVEKPFMVAATKIDVEGDGRKTALLQTYCRRRKIPFFKISAATGAGIKPLILKLGNAVETARPKAAPTPSDASESNEAPMNL